MPLIVETGAGVPNANTYVSLEGANTYLQYHAQRAAWAALTDADKEAALVQAVRALDPGVIWKGDPMALEQARAWPRAGVMIKSATGAGNWNPLYSSYQQEFPRDQVPAAVKDAQCELAALMMQGDRTADADSAGIKSLNLGDSALEIEFDSATLAPMLGKLAPKMLAAYIQGIPGGSGLLPVYRV